MGKGPAPVVLTLLLLILLYEFPTTFAVKDATRVLFIGDSFTQKHDLPSIFRDISYSLDEPVEMKAFVADGWDLEHHWHDEKVLHELKTSVWDFVILQEKVEETYKAPETYLKHVGLFSEYIRKSTPSPNVIITLFLTWANENNGSIQDELTSSILKTADIYGSLVVPCGPTFFAAEDLQIPFWDTDKHNPSVFGSYLCAAVFFTEVFQKSPINASASILDHDQSLLAGQLQTAALSEVASFIPFAPTSLMGYYDNATSSMVITWTESSSLQMNVHTFSVERSTNGSDYVIIGYAETEKFIDKVLSGTYTYRVRSVNKIGGSLYSNLFKITVAPPEPEPIIPTTTPSTTSPTTTSYTPTPPPTTASRSTTTTSSTTSPTSTTASLPISGSTTHKHQFDILPGAHTIEEEVLIVGVGSILLIVVGLFVWRAVYKRCKMKKSKVRFDLIEDTPEY